MSSYASHQQSSRQFRSHYHSTSHSYTRYGQPSSSPSISLPNFSSPSFFLSGHSGLLQSKLIEVLQSRSFFLLANPFTVPSIDFVFLEGDAANGGCYDKRHQVIPSYLKNILSSSKRVITNKGDLHQGLLAHYLQHNTPASSRAIPPSFMFPINNAASQHDDHQFYTSFISQTHSSSSSSSFDISSSSPEHVLIVRPVGPFACAGKSISIATSLAELESAAASIKQANPRWGVLASRYIQNPMLLPNGHKFHIRMYLLVRAASADSARTLPFLAEVFRRGKIFQAASPYPVRPTENSHWEDKAIHDTHVGSTPHNLWFPEDLPRPEDAPRLFQQICEALSCVSRLAMPQARSYPESVHAFEVFGCDFMVDADGRVWLIEINERVGYKDCGDRALQDMPYSYADFSRDIFRWIYTTAVQPVFQTPPLEPQPEPFEMLPSQRVSCSAQHPPFQFCAACACICSLSSISSTSIPSSSSSSSSLSFDSTLPLRKVYPTDYSPIGAPRTFRIVLSAGLSDSVVEAKLSQHFKPFDPAHPDTGLGVLLLGGTPAPSDTLNRELVSYPCVVKNFLDEKRRVITNKWYLFQNIRRIERGAGISESKSCVASSHLVVFPPAHSPHSNYNSDAHSMPSLSSYGAGVFILKPTGKYHAFGGKGVAVVSNQEEFQSAITRAQQLGFSQAVLAKYLPQHPATPLLWNGRKFHLRMYLLVRLSAEPLAHPVGRYRLSWDLWTRGKIITAAVPYEAKDWTNRDIHDSHGGSTPHNLWFPEDLPDPSQRDVIFKQIYRIAQHLVGILSGPDGPQPYPESAAHSFHVFGLDLLVLAPQHVVLMEVNERVGLATMGEPQQYTVNEVSQLFYQDGKYSFDDFSADYMDWVIEHGIKPVFDLETPQPLKSFGVEHPPQFTPEDQCNPLHPSSFLLPPITCTPPPTHRNSSSSAHRHHNQRPTYNSHRPPPSGDFHKRNHRPYNQHEFTYHSVPKRFRKNN